MELDRLFWEGSTDYKIAQRNLIAKSVIYDISPIQAWRNGTSLSVLYRYFYGSCLYKLHYMVMSLLKNFAQRFSISLMMCRTHGYIQDIETRYQTSVFQKIMMWICLRRGATSTLLLNRVIFDVIDGYVSASHYFVIIFYK